jgi:hypothetical protein
VAQVIEHLPRKGESLNSNQSTIKIIIQKKKKEKKKERKKREEEICLIL